MRRGAKISKNLYVILYAFLYVCLNGGRIKRILTHGGLRIGTGMQQSSEWLRQGRHMDGIIDQEIMDEINAEQAGIEAAAERADALSEDTGAEGGATGAEAGAPGADEAGELPELSPMPGDDAGDAGGGAEGETSERAGGADEIPAAVLGLLGVSTQYYWWYNILSSFSIIISSSSFISISNSHILLISSLSKVLENFRYNIIINLALDKLLRAIHSKLA